MDSNTAKDLIKGTFNFPFEESRFRNFAINLLNTLDEEKSFGYISGNYIKDKFKDHITKYRRLGTYTDPSDAKIDVLVVQIKNEWALERSRSTLRNFVADYLSNRDSKDAALVAYFSSDPDDWRFSYIRMEYKLGTSTSGKVTVRKDITPAKRFSFLVGKNEPNHTAQAQLLPILEDDHHNPTLSSLEAAFSVDKVTKQFYQDYRGLYEKLKKELDDIVTKDTKIKQEFEGKSLTTNNFAKKLLGQIVFLYFLQKKGWLGVGKNRDGNFKKWGQGPKNFLRILYDREFLDYSNFFNDVLEPLFYEALATERPENVYSRFNCKIPFLNGGLFEPLNQYNWSETDIKINNSLIEQIFETFDRYNFTVREDEPLETEVAVDPEMLGKVFENLIDENERKGKGAFYTPRTIVHYMCQESLISYLVSECPSVPQADVQTLIHESDIILELESAIEEGTMYEPVLMDSIKDSASELDKALASVKICDPAIGSGAFPVGMLSEIVKTRRVLQLYTHTKDSIYELKRHSIQHSLYGVDIDPGATEIAKLRLWLSLVVDENDYNSIQPLPNLDYKIMQGNSLVEEFHGISLDIQKKSEQKDFFSSGAELDKMIDELHEKQSEFFDADHPREKQTKRRAVETAIFDIFHTELKKKKNISVVEANGIESDLEEMTQGNKIRNFFPWKLYFADVYHDTGGFDIVIGNPPYIGERKHKDVFLPVQRANMSKYYLGRMDYFYFFFHLALDLLSESGNSSFITTNYFPTALGARKLRKDLRERATITSIVNFNELKIFDTAAGQHNMITSYRKVSNGNRGNTHVCQVARSGTATEDLLKRILSGQDVESKYNLLKPDQLWEDEESYMRLSGNLKADTPVQRILLKVKNSSGSELLGKVCNTIIGLESSADDVYVVSKFNLPQIVRTAIDKTLLKDFYKNSDIQRYWSKSQSEKSIIYVHEKISNIQSYKGIWEYLCNHRTKLSSRKGANLRGAFRRGHWWVLNTPRLKLDFESEKLVTPYRSKTNRFSYNNIPWYASRDVYYITRRDSNIQLKYVLALLNSKLYYLWLYHKGKRKGDMLELYSKPLSEIPIKKIGKDGQTVFVDLVNEILHKKEHNPDSDTTSLEQKIDQLVYDLYELSIDDIRIIEASQHA